MENLRIIPRLDIKGPNVIKGVFTEGLRVVGNPIELAEKYYLDGADEIVYMDIVASLYQRNLDFDLLKLVAEKIYIPLTVGGGIRSIGDINNALRAGADKVAINTYAIHHPKFINQAAKEFGSQCVVLSVEAKRISPSAWEAFTDGGRERTGVDAIDWIKRAVDLGIGEVMITSIDNEGSKKGFDLDLCLAVTSFVQIPVIIHGGAGDMVSIRKAIQETEPDAIALASALHYKDYSIKSLKKFLAGYEFNIRLN